MAPFNPQDDPLGIGVQQQARQRYMSQLMNGQQSPIGPLPDIRWQGWFQALENAAGGKPIAMAGGASPEGSNQLTGIQTPGDFAGEEDYGGRHPYVTGHRTGQAAMPESQDSWSGRMKHAIFGLDKAKSNF